jgi:hypothetical protein
MKSFKIREGNVLVDGVMYSDSTSDTKIMGKAGRIQSISIGGRQFFPYGGTYIDSTLVVTDDSTEGVEEIKPVKKTRKSK